MKEGIGGFYWGEFEGGGDVVWIFVRKCGKFINYVKKNSQKYLRSSSEGPLSLEMKNGVFDYFQQSKIKKGICKLYLSNF